MRKPRSGAEQRRRRKTGVLRRLRDDASKVSVLSREDLQQASNNLVGDQIQGSRAREVDMQLEHGIVARSRFRMVTHVLHLISGGAADCIVVHFGARQRRIAEPQVLQIFQAASVLSICSAGIRSMPTKPKRT